MSLGDVLGRSETNHWRRGRDSNPRWGLAHTRFPGVRLKPLIHLSAKPRIVAAREGGLQAFDLLAPIICIADPISAETSVMLPGTMRVVVASAATLP